MKNIFLICPVSIASQEDRERIKNYITKVESEEECKVYYPAIHTNQDDFSGYRICKDNAKAIKEADEVHIFWNKYSRGSLFDLGVAFAYGKPLVIANPEDIDMVEGKSFENMISYWSFL